MWNLSHVQLGLLYVTAVVFGANVIIICWNASQRQSVWGPVMGTVAMLFTSYSVLRAAKKQARVG